jgi:hypothetical protein
MAFLSYSEVALLFRMDTPPGYGLGLCIWDVR